jgi:lipoprotein signal peptidase
LIWPWALIIIGAISNLLDRIYQGGVIDFINFFGLTVINFSDIYISLGVAWLLFDELKKNKRIKV